MEYIEYEQPKNNTNLTSRIKKGDYIKITKGQFKNCIGKVVGEEIDFIEKIPHDNYRDSERAGQEIITNETKK